MSFSAFKNQFKQKEFSYQLLSDNIYTDICGGLHWPADVLVRRWCNVGISCSPLDKWFRTYSSSSETQQDTLLLTGLLLIGVLCSLFRKVLKLLVYLSGNYDGCTDVLDTADPVSGECFRAPCSVPLETFGLAMIWRQESRSLLTITVLTLSFIF